MEVITPLDRFLLISTSGRTSICPSGDPHACRTIPTADAIAEAGADVFFQRPAQILDAIGATEVAGDRAAEREVPRPRRMLRGTGRDEHVEWCYAMDDTGVVPAWVRDDGLAFLRSNDDRLAGRARVRCIRSNFVKGIKRMQGRISSP